MRETDAYLKHCGIDTANYWPPALWSDIQSVGVENTLFGTDAPSLNPLLPTAISLIESRPLAQSRYAHVGELMRAAGLDCLIAPPGDGLEAQASSRYLTQIGGTQGGAWAVLPLDGEATAIVASERELRMWQDQGLQWPTDLRWGDRLELLVTRLRELGVTRGRVGVAGLADVFHNPDGPIPYQA